MPAIFHEQRGAMTLALAIVVFFSALALALILQFTQMGGLLGSRGLAVGEQAFQSADTCLSEALLRLRRDNSYAGEVLNIAGNSCTIVVSGSGSTRTLDVEANVQNFTRHLRATVTLSSNNLTLDTWEELTD